MSRQVEQSLNLRAIIDLQAMRRFQGERVDLKSIVQDLPNYAPILLDVLLTDRPEFQRIVKNGSDFCNVAAAFPKHVAALMDILVEPAEFKRVIKSGMDLAEVAEICSKEHANDLLQIILDDPAEFKRVVHDPHSFNRLVKAFPKHVRQLYQQALKDLSLETFKICISNSLDLWAVVTTFFDYRSILLNILLTNRLEFRRIVRSVDDFKNLKAVFPERVEDLVAILFEQGEYKRVIHSVSDLLNIATICPKQADTLLQMILVDPAEFKRVFNFEYNLLHFVDVFPKRASQLLDGILQENNVLSDADPHSARSVVVAQLKVDMKEAINRHHLPGNSEELLDLVIMTVNNFKKFDQLLTQISALHHPDASSYRTKILGHFKIKINELAKTPRPGLEKKLEMLSARKNHFEQFDRIAQEFLAIIMKYKGSNPERLKQIEAIKEAVVTAYLNSYDDHDHLSEDLGQTLFSLQEKIMAIREQVLQDHKTKGHGRLFGKGQSQSTLVQLIDRALSIQPLCSLQIILNNVMAKPTTASIRLLFREFAFSEIDPRCYDSLGQVLSQESVWPTAPFSKKDIKAIETTKPALVACIQSIRDHKQGQLALWQALLPNTLLGSIFNITQDRVTPSLSTSKNKRKIVAALIANISDHGFLLDHEPTRNALYDNVQLQKEIQKTYPELYSQLAANRLIKRESSVVVQSDLFKHAEVGAINDVDNFDEGKSKGFGLGMITDDDL